MDGKIEFEAVNGDIKLDIKADSDSVIACSIETSLIVIESCFPDQYAGVCAY